MNESHLIPLAIWRGCWSGSHFTGEENKFMEMNLPKVSGLERRGPQVKLLSPCPLHHIVRSSSWSISAWVCYTPATRSTAPTEFKTETRSDHFVSHCDFQRQVFSFSKWKIEGITRHPRYPQIQNTSCDTFQILASKYFLLTDSP